MPEGDIPLLPVEFEHIDRRDDHGEFQREHGKSRPAPLDQGRTHHMLLHVVEGVKVDAERGGRGVKEVADDQQEIDRIDDGRPAGT